MAEHMTKTELKLWRDRLHYAKREWTRRGLIGSHEASTMRLLIDFYRGKQWVDTVLSSMGLELEMVSTANKIFPIANSLMGEIASRNPKVKVFPLSEDSVSKAMPVQHLINYDIDELNFRRQTNKALMHNLFAPVAFVRHGFTPREEWETESGRRMSLYRPGKPDRPWIRAVPIWDVLLNPDVESFHPDEDMPWVAFLDNKPLRDIRDNPNMISREGLKNYAGNVAKKRSRGERRPQSENPDAKDLVEYYTVYDARERKWFQITLDGLDKPIRESKDWPIDWETLPISAMQLNEQMDTPFPLAILDAAVPIQAELNRLRTMMGQLVFRLRRLIGYDKNKIENAEITKIETGAINEMIAMTGLPAEVVQSIGSGVFPQELLQYHEILEENLREATGQSKMGRAQRINVESAHEAAFVQQGQDVSTERIADAFREFNQDIVRLYMQGRRATMDLTGDELVRIVGSQDVNGLQAWAPVSSEDLHGDFDFHVVHGSTLPRDKDREAEKAGADLQIALASPDLFKTAYFARKYLEARDIEPVRGMTDEALTASAIRTLDAMRRNAQVGEEAPAEGAFPANVANAISAPPVPVQ